jgi:nucleoside-diphosphate-sugar epimerase
MPVIVVGADTRHGREIVDRLLQPGREIRAFVTDPEAATALRDVGVKVALGDVSDDSHVEGAAMHCFSAVLIAEAARDGRERSFAETEDQVLEGWARAVSAAGVTRVIWIHDGRPPEADAPESAQVTTATPNLAQAVFDLDDAARIT